MPVAAEPKTEERLKGREEPDAVSPVGDVPESYVPPKPMRRIRSLGHGRKKFVENRGDFKNEVNALLDQNGIDYVGSLWTDRQVCIAG